MLCLCNTENIKERKILNKIHKNSHSEWIYKKNTKNHFTVPYTFFAQKMVYGKIFFNNIKEYTPTWFRTIPYQQTQKQTIGKQPSLASICAPNFLKFL